MNKISRTHNRVENIVYVKAKLYKTYWIFHEIDQNKPQFTRKICNAEKLQWIPRSYFNKPTSKYKLLKQWNKRASIIIIPVTFLKKVGTQEESESVTKTRTEQVYNYPEKVMSNRKRKPTASAKVRFLKLVFINWNILSPYNKFP